MFSVCIYSTVICKHAGTIYNKNSFVYRTTTIWPDGHNMFDNILNYALEKQHYLE